SLVVIIISDDVAQSSKLGTSADDSQSDNKVGPELLAKLYAARSGETIPVILQLNAKPTGQLNALLNRNGIHVKRYFDQFNSYAVELPASVVDELALYDEVEFLSHDAPVAALGGHIANTTGANLVLQQTNYTLDDSGIGHHM